MKVSKKNMLTNQDNNNPDASRTAAVACFRLLTNQDYLRSYLFRIGIAIAWIVLLGFLSTHNSQTFRCVLCAK